MLILLILLSFLNNIVRKRIIEYYNAYNDWEVILACFGVVFAIIEELIHINYNLSFLDALVLAWSNLKVGLYMRFSNLKELNLALFIFSLLTPQESSNSALLESIKCEYQALLW